LPKTRPNGQHLGLSSSISSQFIFLQPKIDKKSLKPPILEAQGHLKLLMLTFLRSSLPVRVMISGICACLQPFLRYTSQ